MCEHAINSDLSGKFSVCSISRYTLCPKGLVFDKTSGTYSIKCWLSDGSEYFYLYRISYAWYSFIGFTVTILVGLIVSAIYRCNSVFLSATFLEANLADVPSPIYMGVHGFWPRLRSTHGFNINFIICFIGTWWCTPYTQIYQLDLQFTKLLLKIVKEIKYLMT